LSAQLQLVTLFSHSEIHDSLAIQTRPHHTLQFATAVRAMAAAAAGVPAIDRAIAKLDAILLTASGGGGAGAGGVAGATQAAAGGSVKPGVLE
jgi:hypothetical protein